MKAVVAAFNQEKALVGAFSVITNLRMELFQALVPGGEDPAARRRLPAPQPGLQRAAHGVARGGRGGGGLPRRGQPQHRLLPPAAGEEGHHRSRPADASPHQGGHWAAFYKSHWITWIIVLSLSMDNICLLPLNSFYGSFGIRFIRHFDTIPHFADVRTVGVPSVGVSQRNVRRWQQT